MNNEKPICSIIIPSFKRAHLLKWGLQSLSQQKTKYPFEVIVLNDGIPDETEKLCNKYKDKLNIRYIFTGQRNLKESVIWRCPGFALNIGVKQSKGKYIILTCPEIFHLDNCAINKMITILKTDAKILVKTQGKDDRKGMFLEYIKNKDPKGKIDKSKASSLRGLQVFLPFFLGMKKKTYIDIGGYDEDFIGWAYDDTDFVARLKRYGCKHEKINSTIVHLYHPRHRLGIKSSIQLYNHNKNLYEQKNEKGIIYSNVGKEWGKSVNNNLIKQQKIIEVYKKRTEKWNLIKIPKIAHFYWGNEQLPFLRYLTVLSFHKFNPNWKIKVYIPKFPVKEQTWTTHEQKYIFTGKDYFPELKKLPIKIIPIDMRNIGIKNHISEVYKSDFLRWYLLATVGGLWSDMDIIYFKSINNLEMNREELIQMDTVVCIGKQYGHSIGFMLSSPKNRYFSYIYKQAVKKFNPSNYQSIGVKLLNNEFPCLEAISKKFPITFPVNIPESTVYPYNATKIKEIYVKQNLDKITKDTIGLHWYAGHPIVENYVNKITEENFLTLTNILGITIKKALI